MRVENEDELIKEGEEFTRVEGILTDPETELMVLINRPSQDLSFRKKVMVNGISRRVLDFIGNLPAVIFYPSDINMVTGPPSLRRWHLDLALAQVDFDYKKTLTQYEQFLTSRNRVLKRIREGHSRVDELDYWTKELVEKGKVISEKRREFFEFINGLEKPLGEFIFEHVPSEITFERLEETNGREVAAAATLIGPHRDDYRVILNEWNVIARTPSLPAVSLSNLSRETKQSVKEIATGRTVQYIPRNDESGRDLAHFGSRGEQRTATLAFKLAQLEYMAKILGKRPILLLDDVFSELDANHRTHVVEVVGKQQTIIATVELDNIPKDFLDSSRILRVENGKISE